MRTVRARDLISVWECLLYGSNSANLDCDLVGKVNNDQRDKTAVHDVWKRSHALIGIGIDWKDTASVEERQQKIQHLVQLSERFTEIVGEDGGTYINEANP